MSQNIRGESTYEWDLIFLEKWLIEVKIALPKSSTSLLKYLILHIQEDRTIICCSLCECSSCVALSMLELNSSKAGIDSSALLRVWSVLTLNNLYLQDETQSFNVILILVNQHPKYPDTCFCIYVWFVVHLLNYPDGSVICRCQKAQLVLNSLNFFQISILLPIHHLKIILSMVNTRFYTRVAIFKSTKSSLQRQKRE